MPRRKNRLAERFKDLCRLLDASLHVDLVEQVVGEDGAKDFGLRLEGNRPRSACRFRENPGDFDRWHWDRCQVGLGPRIARRGDVHRESLADLFASGQV